MTTMAVEDTDFVMVRVATEPGFRQVNLIGDRIGFSLTPEVARKLGADLIAASNEFVPPPKLT
jgi:hypothetical protein